MGRSYIRTGLGNELELEILRNRPNRFRGLVYNGDWHTKLVTALRLARDGTGSKEMLATIEVLERQLVQTDECVHTVTATQAVPFSMGALFLLNHIKQTIDVEPSTLNVSPNGDIELTITARGDRDHVFSLAQAILSSGLARAKGAILVETMP